MHHTVSLSADTIRRPRRPDGAPAWWECSWRRVTCRRLDCRMCSKLAEHEAAHRSRGENPDDFEHTFEGVTDERTETETTLEANVKTNEVEQSAQEISSDKSNVPDPRDTALWQNVHVWVHRVADSVSRAEKRSAIWLFTEEAEDLMWYKSTLLVKLARQIDNRWALDNTGDVDDLDYAYTRYVLFEVLDILDQSLTGLKKVNPRTFNKLHKTLEDLAPAIRRV